MPIPAGTAWFKILIVYAGGVAAATQLGIVPPIATTVQHDLGASLALIAVATSVPTLVGAAGGTIVGLWAERVGHVRTLCFGLAIMAAMAAAGAVVADGVTFLLLRGLLGVGYLMVVSAAPSLIARLSTLQHRPLALSLWGTFVPAGLAAAALLVALVIADAGWRACFWIDAALLASMAVIVALVMEDGDGAGFRSQERRHAMPRLHAPFLLAAGFFCFAWTFLAVAATLPAALTLGGRWNTADVGWLLAVTAAGGAAGSLLAGPLMRWGMPLQVLAAVGFLVPAAASFFVFADRASMAWIAAGLAIFFVAGGAVPAAAFAAVPRLARDMRSLGPVNGLIAQSGCLGSLTGPPLLALWVERAGWPSAPWPVAAVSVAGLLCCCLAFRNVASPAT
jgi:MFS family permease